MAIQFLKPLFAVLLAVALVGCEKWADGVIREVRFPEHQSELAATVVLTGEESKAIASLYATASTLDVDGSVRPDGVEARVWRNGTEVLHWQPGDTGLVGEEWDQQMMHVLHLDSPLNLPEGLYSIEVTAPGFETLTAEALQPPLIDISMEVAFGVDTVVENDKWSYGWLDVRDEISFDLINRSGLQDVYGLRITEAYVEDGADTSWYTASIGEDGIDIDPRLDFNGACNCFIIDDQNMDGNPLTDFRIDRMRYLYDDPYFSEASVLRVEVIWMSPGLGDFYRSIDRHRQASDNPFANPSTVFSNTSTGFGCFGLASRVFFTFE
jgi:hypothetical protein